jgi:4-hydroxybenzoyl-CoA reductase subunit beta
VLTLPRFAWSSPATVAEVLAELAAHPGECLLVAGGTDVVPNLKHRLLEPRRIVHLGAVTELRGIREEGGAFELGALVTLRELAADEGVRGAHPALSTAAGLVASPQVRAMGTLGGNLCLDTRCTYYNQTFFWREALGFCLKKDGTRCHVVPQGKRCVAAHSSDVAPVLIALGAEVEIASGAGRRWLDVDSFFVGDGLHNNVLAPGELVTRLRVPAAAHGALSAYRKLRPRAAIDFPMLSVAVAARGSRERVESIRVVVGALGARPKLVGGLDAVVAGRAADENLFANIASVAHQQCRPLTNVPYDADWRHEMVKVEVTRALRDAFAERTS